MDPSSQLDDQSIDPKYLLNQLNTARKEINNLRQQIKSLRYIFDKDVSGIKRLIGIYSKEDDPGQAAENSLTTTETSSSSSSSPQSNNQTPQLLPNGPVLMNPIGIINTGFPSKRGTPRQPGICKESRGKITLFNTIFTNPEHSLNNLEDFSHMWILFHFHRNDSTHVRAKVAPPRLNGARTGVFSTRSPHRPCPIGLSLVRIISIERNSIIFEGVDIVDGTPVFDIKPYIPQYDNPLYVESVTSREHNGNLDNDNRQELLNHAVGGDGQNGAWQLIPDDVSRDEEIALRLQAEEFEQIPPDNNSNIDEIVGQLSNERPSNLDETIESAVLEVSGDDELRNSRLLDGADGPSNVWGTDMDFISRRSLNIRVDNSSPVRMGVREAPDGEEGMESQSLRPSQTIGNIPSVNTSSSTTTAATTVRSTNTASLQNINEASSNNDRVDDNVVTNQIQIRVPDWITQSHTRTLSVVFNERAIYQLNDIVKDNSGEQKRAIENVLREDPRSVYLRQRWANQFYTFLIHDLHISCRFDDNRGVVTVFQVRPAGRICECGEPEWQCLGHSPNS